MAFFLQARCGSFSSLFHFHFFLTLLWRKCYKEKETNSKMTITEGATHGVIFVCAGFAIVWAFIQFRIIAQTEVRSVDGADRDNSSLLSKKRPLVEEAEAGGSSSSTGKHLHLPVLFGFV
jgi:hypothetical protein